MTTSTLTVTDFVLARLDEDEAAASIATPGPWFVDQVGDFGDKGAALEIARWRGHLNTVDLGEDFLTADHIARHDPARVLAQCAAMRKIVEVHHAFHVTTRNDGLNWNYRGCSECNEPEDWEPAQGDYWPCGTILALASIWSDHPDFNPAWS